MRASAYDLRREAEVKVRATALRCTREAVCPACGQLARLHVEAQDYCAHEGDHVVAASACATWECCGQVGRAYREVVQA